MPRSPLLASLRRRLALALHQRATGIVDPREAASSLAALRLSRREALTAVASTALTVIPPCHPRNQGKQLSDTGDTQPSDTGLDTGGQPLLHLGRIAVIGGGIAGLHCAYRLAAAGHNPVVYEASTRTGGRMYTGRGLFLDGQVCELGGELIDSNHATLWALADELGILLVDRFTLDEETWWIQGVAVPTETLIGQLLDILPTANEHVAQAEATDIDFAKWDAMSLREWLETFVPGDPHGELRTVLDVAYRGEFGLETDLQSCLNMLYMLSTANDTDPAGLELIGDSDERWHAQLGSDAFPAALAAGLDPSQIQVDRTLTRASVEPDGSYSLTFRDSSGGEHRFTVDHLVFALPFSTLRDVDLADLGLSAEKLNIIETLGYGTNTKVMAGFSRPVWSEDHGASGDLTTDLPVQACWDSSIGQGGASAILTNFLSGETGVTSGDGTPEDWVNSVLPDLEAIWPGLTGAYTGTAVRMHWPTVPTMKGSYACYLVGQCSFYGLEGVREGNIHFCGEHTAADWQGWMEGAALTGGLVAAEMLGDEGTELTARHRRSLGWSLLLPQPNYSHGVQAYPPVRRWERQAILRAAVKAGGA